MLSALSREVGVATEVLVKNAEQVSSVGACAEGLRLERAPARWAALRPGRAAPPVD